MRCRGTEDCSEAHVRTDAACSDTGHSSEDPSWAVPTPHVLLGPDVSTLQVTVRGLSLPVQLLCLCCHSSLQEPEEWEVELSSPLMSGLLETSFVPGGPWVHHGEPVSLTSFPRDLGFVNMWP